MADENPYRLATTPDLKSLLSSLKSSRTGARKIRDADLRKQQVAEYTRIILRVEAELTRRRKS